MNDAKFIKLDNGLTILIYSDNSKISNHIELVTFLGGKCRNVMDNDGNSFDILPGSTHFLEHFICERNINGNLIDNLKEMGALSSNAMTGNYDTSFYVDTVVSFDECLDMFLNSVYHPVFNKKNIDDTRGPVLCEIRDDNDNFRRKISYRVMSNVFANNVKTLGNKSSVKRITASYLKKLYDYSYVPCNQLLVLAGSFDSDKVLDKIKAFYDKLSFKCNNRISYDKEKKEVIKKRDVFICDIMEQGLISFKIDVSGFTDFERYKLDWYFGAFSLINFSKYSDISESISNNSFYKGNISYSKGDFGDYVLFEVSVYTDRYDEFENLVMTTIDNFKNNTREEFEYYKKHCKTEVSVRKDSISGYIIPIMQNYIQFNYPFDDTIDFIDSLNYDEYIAMIGRLDFSNYSYLCIKKK